MKIRDLMRGVDFELISGNVECEIMQVVADSRVQTRNGLMIAMKGDSFDGHNYINQAIENGAVAIVVDSECESSFYENTTIIKVENSRKAMSLIAKNFYLNGKIPNSIKFIGVTGTNGKTTTTFMLKHILRCAGYDVGVVGTSGVFFNDEVLAGEGLTTPDPLELFETISKFEVLGADFVLMEVSAHALYYEKTAGLRFDFSIFTNLTQDHMDFFRTMENYGDAKSKLFDKLNSDVSIINIDDKFGARLYKHATSDTIAIGSVGDCYIKKYSKDESCFVANVFGKILNIKLNMGGLYNIYNALGVVAVATMLGIKSKFILKGLKTIPEIAGRYNVFNMAENGKVILDFAHTPDGLEKVLTRARLDIKKDGKLISLFGCGGNRDKDKRAVMGAIAGKLADFVVISIDNPRFEDPDVVMEDIATGVRNVGGKYKIIMPRSKAIKSAVEMCGPNDIVVVSGKGVEPYYEQNGIKCFYREDREIVKIQKSKGIINRGVKRWKI